MIDPLGQLSAEIFLKDYWQKKPLLIRSAIPGFVSPLSGDELAGLACEEEIESRLIIGKGNDWACKSGPFDSDDFARLPPSHWTLLVQAVDHWEPAAQELLEHFRFIPDWRLDDLMISYAVEGGGVGPHFDNYDVFLLQGEGQRRWRVGQHCDEQTTFMDTEAIRLLADFHESENFVLNPGDMLYLPPGVAHWGEAVGDNCITCSIGFRAPSYGEVLEGFSHHISEQLSDRLRYSDADLKLQASPGEITTDAILRVQNILKEALEQPEQIAQWLGQHMTEPKYPDHLEETGIDEDQLSAGTRLAWHQGESHQLMLFVNGSVIGVMEEKLEAVKALCDHRTFTDDIEQQLGNSLIKWIKEKDVAAE